MKIHVRELTKKRVEVARAGTEPNLGVLLQFIIDVLTAVGELFVRKSGPVS
jgi:hypothetical protein